MRELSFEKQSEIFERTVRDRDGRLFCVRFVVVEREGVLRGKVISCEQIYTIRTANRYPSPTRRRTGVGRKYEHRTRRPYFPFVKGGTRVREGEGFYLPARQVHQAANDKGLRIKDFFPSPYFNRFDFLTVIKIRAPARSV